MNSRDQNAMGIHAIITLGHLEGRPFNASNLSEYLDIPRTTVIRKLRWLIAEGFIEQKGHTYYLAPKYMNLPDEVYTKLFDAIHRLSAELPNRTAVNRGPKWTVSETDTKNWNVHNYPRVDPVPHNHRSMIYDGRAAHDFVTCSKAPLTKILLTTICGSGAKRVRRTCLVRETSQLLSRLPTHLATDLFASATRVKLAANQVLFLAGDPGDSCYRVEDGLLKVTMVSRSGIERILSFISRGGIVGELAILDGLPRSASVVAVRETVLSRLSRAEFDAFAEEHPELYKSLITLLTQRLRETNVAVAAGSFLSLQVALPLRCSNWRTILGGMSDRTASSFSIRSARATSRPWLELLAKT